MADTDPPKKPKRTVKKLPPLQGESEEGAEVKKVVKKKKKKPPEETANGTTPKSPDGTPRKKKKPAAKPEGEKEENGDAAPKPTPRKKKKKPVAKTEGGEGDPTSARSQGEDVAGSKTSLISKEQTGTPKKKVKKKVKKTTPRKEEDEFLDTTLAADLTTIQEDIISPREKKEDTTRQGEDDEEEEEEERRPYSTEGNILKSQPLNKLFIETDSGFKGQNKAKLAKKWAEAEAIKADEAPQVKRTTIELALSTHNGLKTFLLFIHGLTAGISIWHITMTYILLFFNYIDFLEHYRILALPVQCMFYILLVLCTVSCCDRFDVGNPNRRFLLQSLTLQTGTISVLIYFAALVISLCTANLEDKMNLYHTNTTLSGLWNDPVESNSDIDLWKSLNTARCVLAILGWLIIALGPNTDRLYSNLRKADDNILGGNSMQLASSAA